jgi:imidazolonepropionase-like amidohydrolase
MMTSGVVNTVRGSVRQGLLTAALLLASTMCANARGQDITPEGAIPAGLVVVRNITIHPVNGAVVERGEISFENGIVTYVGAERSIAEGTAVAGLDASLDAKNVTIDGGGLHAYPGLIAVNSQLGLSEISALRPTTDTNETGEVTPEARAATAFSPDSLLIPVTRSNGILLAGVFPIGGLIPGTVSVMRLDGWTAGDMTVRADAGVIVAWPSMRTFKKPVTDKSEDDQRKEIRDRVRVIEDWFDRARSYVAIRKADPKQPIDLRLEALRASLPAAKNADGSAAWTQRPTFIHANDLDQIFAAAEFCRSRGLRGVIVGGRAAPEAAATLKALDIPVIVAGVFQFPSREDMSTDEAFTLPARLKAAGLRFAIASGEEEPQERNLPYGAAKAAAFGLDHDEALRSITLSTAEILGIADRYGSIEQGKSATFILTDGDPLEITSHVKAAFIDGQRSDLSNHQTRLRDKYETKYPQTKGK